MFRYQVTFTMQTGCQVPAEEIRRQVQDLLGKVQMSARTVASVAVSELGLDRRHARTPACFFCNDADHIEEGGR